MSGSTSNSSYSDQEEQNQEEQEEQEQEEEEEEEEEQEEEEQDQCQPDPKKKFYPKGYKIHEHFKNTIERNRPEVEVPIGTIMTDEQFYDSEGKPNIENIKEHLRREGKISSTQINKLIEDTYALFCAEDNILFVEAPLTVCGDIHGQYYDLLKLLEVGGDPKDTRYLFLGDYVDRGHFSMECIILLFSYKISFPTTFWMIRGNHECRHLTEYFTFKEECEHKYGADVYDALMDTFDALPLAAIMNKQFFCVHGGLSNQIQTIQQIQEIDRFTETPPSGPMCDLLWADPMENFNSYETFVFNAVRGCSWNYGYGAVCEFLEQNKLLSIIRAHEAQDSGYKMFRRNEKTGFPSVITLFSAPNYLDSYNNKGAIMRYENNVINIRQFNCSPHPYNLPGFMNVFAWSLPFVAEKVGELLMSVLRLVDDAEADIEEQVVSRKKQELRSKIRGVSRFVHVLRKMREEREKLVMAGPLSPNGTELPPALDPQIPVESPKPKGGSLRDSFARRASLSFADIKEIDRANEARPPTPVKTDSPAGLRNSQDGIVRRASRDNILLQRRWSSEKFDFAKILSDSGTELTAPQITEEKIS